VCASGLVYPARRKRKEHKILIQHAFACAVNLSCKQLRLKLYVGIHTEGSFFLRNLSINYLHNFCGYAL
jgi:hypothetical protein